MNSVPQLTSARYTAVLLDQTGTPVPASSLSTLTLTLKDQASGAVINGRNAQSVLNANNVTVEASGNLVWSLQPADSPILNAELGTETHLATFVAIWPSGRLNHVVAIPVQNLGLAS